jgi:hypothetical protein
MGDLTWRKSSYSGEDTNCVELNWRKSSYSGSNSNCVEVAAEGAVRDSKNPGGPVLTVDITALLAAAKSQSSWRTSRRIGQTTGT